MIRRVVIVSVIAIAVGGLAACGKKGTPQPPGDSDFPRPYPSPSMYPQPNVPYGTSSRSPSPEQGVPSATTDENSDAYGFNPGQLSR